MLCTCLLHTEPRPCQPTPTAAAHLSVSRRQSPQGSQLQPRQLLAPEHRRKIDFQSCRGKCLQNYIGLRAQKNYIGERAQKICIGERAQNFVREGAQKNYMLENGLRISGINTTTQCTHRAAVENRATENRAAMESRHSSAEQTH